MYLFVSNIGLRYGDECNLKHLKPFCMCQQNILWQNRIDAIVQEMIGNEEHQVDETPTPGRGLIYLVLLVAMVMVGGVVSPSTWTQFSQTLVEEDVKAFQTTFSWHRLLKKCITEV